jgi:hypothetical protein
MEIAGTAGGKAASDPLGLASFQKRPASFFPAGAAGFSNSEVLLKLDRDGLERSDTMVEILLHGKNRRMAEEVAKILGYRPVEAVRGFLMQLRKDEPSNPRWRRGLARLDELRAASRQEFLRDYLLALEPDDYGLSYIRKIGEVGTPADIPVLVAAIETVDHLYLKLALAEAAMALGDRKVADRAARLVKNTQSIKIQAPVDALLLGIPAHCTAARDRLLAGLESPNAFERWRLMKSVVRCAKPGYGAAAVDVAAKALSDEQPWIRLAALAVLWRLNAGNEVVERALTTETEGYLKDAYREFLARGT